MTYRSKILVLSLCGLLQVACSNNTVYPDESFSYDSLFKLRTDGEVALACESARRSLLGEGYLIENATSEGVIGRKAYKSEGKENTFIEMNVVCLPETNGSTVFATGVLSTYALKMSSSSASVGLSALGSISLPIGQSADSLVKVSEETIDDQDFYRRFFAAVDTILSDLKAGKAASEPVAEPAVPAPTPAPAPVVPESAPVPVAPAQVSEPVPVVTAPKMTEPELTPVQAAPAPVPEPEHPAPVIAESIPAPLPAQEVPAVVPEPVPAPTAPAIVPVPEAAPVQDAPAPLVEPSNGVTTGT
jgi:hypothetical protein